MRTKIITLLLTAGVLLAGCTPAASSGDTAQVASQPASTAEIQDTTIQDTTTSSTPASTSTSETSSAGSEASTSIVTSGSTSRPAVSWPEPPTPTPIVPDDDGQAGDPPAEQPGPPVSEEPTPEPEPNWEVEHVYWFPDDNPYEESFTPSPNNAGTPDDYITVEYHATDLLFSFNSRQTFYVGDRPLGIGTVNHAYPIECLRQLDENTYYAVYKAKEGGYIYVHFQKMLEEPSWDENYYNGIYAVTSVIYVREPLDYADFSEIKIGDSITDIEAIDPASCAWITMWSKMYDGMGIRQTLTDGAIFIEALKDDNGDFTVSKIRYFPDGIEDFSERLDTGLEINHNILPQDFPQ